MSASNNTQLVCDALGMAIEHRAPEAGLLHHSDQGITYTSTRYRELLKENGITASMSRIGNCHDNAVAESFIANLKNELTYHHDFKTRHEARTAIFDYIELFYDRKRPQQTLNYLSPVEYETMRVVAQPGVCENWGGSVCPLLFIEFSQVTVFGNHGLTTLL